MDCAICGSSQPPAWLELPDLRLSPACAERLTALSAARPEYDWFLNRVLQAFFPKSCIPDSFPGQGKVVPLEGMLRAGKV